MMATHGPGDLVVLKRSAGLGRIALFFFGIAWSLGGLIGGCYACTDTQLTCTRQGKTRDRGECLITSHFLGSSYASRTVDLGDIDDVTVVTHAGKSTTYSLAFETYDGEKIAIGGSAAESDRDALRAQINAFLMRRKTARLALTIDPSHVFIAPIGIAWAILIAFGLSYYTRSLHVRFVPGAIQIMQKRTPLRALMTQVPRREVGRFEARMTGSKSTALMLIASDGREQMLFGGVTIESNAHGAAAALNARLTMP